MSDLLSILYNVSQVFRIFIANRFPQYLRPSSADTSVSMVRCASMNSHDDSKDASTLLGLLRRDEDSLNDVGKQLVKEDRLYAKQVFSTAVDGWTPFHAFVLRGARKIIKIALKAGVDVNLRMGELEGLPGGCTPLHLAAHRGDVSVINILLSSGADVNMMDNTEKAPVYYAVRANNTLAVKALARAGADVKGCDVKNTQSDDTTTSSPMICFLPFACAGIRR